MLYQEQDPGKQVPVDNHEELRQGHSQGMRKDSILLKRLSKRKVLINYTKRHQNN